jgi:threonyl-tRNA synthetase
VHALDITFFLGSFSQVYWANKPHNKNMNRQPLPGREYFKARLERFEKFKARRQQELGDRIGQKITVTLPDGNTKEAEAYKTTPMDIATAISQGLAQNVVVAKVDDVLWDLTRPLERDCKLELLKFDHKDAQEVFWHSSSHVLGEALEHIYECLLCKGPPGEDGFYYEAYMADKIVREEDFDKIAAEVNKIRDEKQPFERLMVTKAEALELFAENKFKVEILAEKVPDDAMCSVYRCGDLIDPCKGPHLPNTSRVKSFKVTKNSSSYWRANAKNETLQRVYGISFPDPKLLKEWQKIQDIAKEKDHRKVGKDQELWFWHPLSPGCVFMLPHGTRIFNTLVSLTRSEYRKRGFDEVQTPTMFHNNLWKISGHWDKYQENLFILNVDETLHSLKPMNCPSHCLMFKNRARSYKELPIRYADFGVLHRNELKGALSGMTRVRRFQQDDAHIFCREDQIGQEMQNALSFLSHMYSIFGFSFKVNLSTRPEKFLGDVEVWNRAEKQLQEALDKFIGVGKWGLNPGDGAFYGPKIDVLVQDALKREFQCGTIQLDFQLPIRFDLEYATEQVVHLHEKETEEDKKKKEQEKLEKIQKQKEEGRKIKEQREKAHDKKEQTNKNEQAKDQPQGNEHKGESKEEEFVYVEPPALPVNHPKMARPVIIHRAIYGSLERFMAIVTEHYGGKWPFWLSPRQIIVLPVSNKFDAYCEKVRQFFWDAGYYADADTSSNNIKKKIANAQVAQYNFTLVVGATEEEKNSVNIRVRDITEPLGEKSLDDCLAYFEDLKKQFK